MRKKQSVVIVGAGSRRTPALAASFITLKERFPLDTLVLYDIDRQRMEDIVPYVKLVLSVYSPETKLIVTEDKTRAYEGVDFVFCQMRVGGSEMRGLDEKIPLKHGLIGQETCGPGGFAYGMRSIGAMCEMVKDIRAVNPDAWILNYTNPAAIVGLAMQKVFPSDKRLLSICDQPYSMQKSFGKILGRDLHDLVPSYFGLNHFGWFTGLKDTSGQCVFEELKTYLCDHTFQPYNAEQRAKSWLETYKNVNKMMSFFPDYIPTTYLQYYFFPEELAAKEDPSFTRADEAKEGREKQIVSLCMQAKGRTTMGDLPFLSGSVHGDMMIEIAEAIAYDLNALFVLMFKNDGIIQNLPSDALVEVDARLGKEGGQPNKKGSIEPFYKGLLETQHAYEQLTVEAALEGSYKKALMALTLNRTVVNPQKAKAVLDDLMIANKDYWSLS